MPSVRTPMMPPSGKVGAFGKPIDFSQRNKITQTRDIDDSFDSVNVDDVEKTEEEELDEALLGLFEGHYKPNPQVCHSMYMKALRFKQAINLFDTVRTNENFFIGRVCLPM